MDLETENRIAAMLLKEAAELRRRAEQEGVRAYLEKPTVRGRPNSRFLTATVRAVQQANRCVEVNEMWRVRQKELELDDRLKGQSSHTRKSSSHGETANSSGSSSKRYDRNSNTPSTSNSSSKRDYQESYSREDGGLRDEEVEEFLHSRVKRGRGAVGSRMDETGPYLPPRPDSDENVLSAKVSDKCRAVLGPEKPSGPNSCESSEEELDEKRRKRTKTRPSEAADKKHSRKHKSKEKSRDKRKKRKEEKRRKHK